MIESILLKNTASYDEAGVHIQKLKEVNFIYGSNGSGKTTFSNFLATQESDNYDCCNLQWKYNQPLKCLVYNKNFRENNFGQGAIEGVFTLGQATKDDIELIEVKQDELKNIKKQGQKKRETLDGLNSDKKTDEEKFKNDTWTKVYKKHEASFKEAFQGSMQRESFKNKLLLEIKNNHSSLYDFDELKEKSKTIFGKAPEALPSLRSISYVRINEIEGFDLWNKKIIGKSDVDIAQLIQTLNLDDWVNQGRNHIQENDICPFCQQLTITDDFKKQLEAYFDASFLIDTNKVTTFKDEYDRSSLNLINELTQIEANEKANIETKLNIDKFTAFLKTLTALFATNKELLISKLKEPSRKIELVSTKEQLDGINELISKANIEVSTNNSIVSNYQEERSKLVSEIWKYIVEEVRSDIEAYEKNISDISKSIEGQEQSLKSQLDSYKELNLEIKNLSKNVTSIEPTVIEINNSLEKFGFLNFEIVPSKTELGCYQLQREGGDQH